MMLVELRRLSMMYSWQCYTVKGDIDLVLSKEANDIITKSNFEERVIEVDDLKVFAELERVCGVCYKLGDRVVGVGGIWKTLEWGAVWKIF